MSIGKGALTMGNKERDFGQEKEQPQAQQGQQQGMKDDRSDRESGKPLQLDNDQKADKMNEKQGQQHQGGQHQDKQQPQNQPVK
jgi:hypothetical protein